MKNLGKDKEGRELYHKNYKIELSLVIFLLVASVLIPSLKAELFPYSSFALFTDSPQLYVEYEVTDGEGKIVSPKSVFLHRNYYGISPREPYARIKPFSYDQFGQILKPEVIKKAVLKGEKENAVKLPVKVKQKVFQWTKEGVKNTRTLSHVIGKEVL